MICSGLNSGEHKQVESRAVRISGNDSFHSSASLIYCWPSAFAKARGALVVLVCKSPQLQDTNLFQGKG